MKNTKERNPDDDYTALVWEAAEKENEQ